MEVKKIFNKRKAFRNLDDIYKTSKFLKLYLKMYKYILEIPESNLKSNRIIHRNDYVGVLIDYIKCFLKAKDFYNWKNRLYTLLTKKFSSASLIKYELLFGSKAKYYYNKSLEKHKCTCMNRYGCEHQSQFKEVKEKKKQTFIERYGVDNPAKSEKVREKGIQTSLERYGCKYPSQSTEVKEKIISVKLKKYGNIYGNVKQNNHSNIADEFCMDLYTILPKELKENTIFYKKTNKEYMLKGNDKRYFYDFCIPELKTIVEFDGLYWHGLKEGQKFVRCNNKEVPVEEIWKQDEEKQKLAEMNGFKVIRVREDEYLKNKEEVLNNIIKDIENEAYS